MQYLSWMGLLYGSITVVFPWESQLRLIKSSLLNYHLSLLNGFGSRSTLQSFFDQICILRGGEFCNNVLELQCHPLEHFLNVEPLHAMLITREEVSCQNDLWLRFRSFNFSNNFGNSRGDSFLCHSSGGQIKPRDIIYFSSRRSNFFLNFNRCMLSRFWRRSFSRLWFGFLLWIIISRIG